MVERISAADMQSEIESLRAQAAASEEKFHELFAAMNEGVCFHELIYDGAGAAVDYRIIDINPAYEQNTGFKKETVVGALASQIYQTGRAPFLERYVQVVQTGRPQSFEIYWPPRARHFLVKAFSLGKGQFVSVITDITDSKVKDEELTAIYNNAPVLLMLVDGERRVRKVNSVAGAFAGRPATDLIGLRGGEALRCLNALEDPRGCGFDPQCAQCAVRLAVSDTLETGRGHNQVEAVLPFTLEGQAQQFTFLFSTTPLKVREEPMVLISMMDITRRKQAEEALRESEERFKLLFSNMPVAYQSLDAEGNFIEVNPAWLNALGYSREEVIGKNFGDFLHPRGREQFKANFPRFKALGEIMGVEFEMLKMDGTTVLTSFTGKIGHDPVGRFRQTHCIFQDITAQRRSQTDLAKLEERLQQAQRMEAIGTLAGGIAHDFNNMLFPLVGFAEMLQEDLPADSPLQEHVREILHAALSSRELVQQILAFSRKAERKDRPIRLQTIVKEAIKLLRATIPTTIDIQQRIDGDCPTVIADPTHIHQIVMNLATNAYHAMEEMGGTLGIGLEAVRLESDTSTPDGLTTGPYAHLCVTDTGMGMTKEILSKVFDPYFTTKSDGKGTGLGLSVVHGIVASYQGKVRISSEPGRGTECHVYLPIVERKVLKETAAAEAMRGGTERILLVDDEEAIVRMEQQVLARLGYQVTVRTASVEALEAFKANPYGFDLLLTDMTMPNMTGIQLATAVKAIRPGMPVIICTGFSEQLNDARCAALGIAGFLMKPVAKRAMAQAVRETLDRVRQ